MDRIDFDCEVLIVGAGPAGCAAAYDLARAGRRVLLLDRRSFPRHKACACGLTRKTLKALRYSVEPVIERACREVVLQEAGPRFAEGVRVADKVYELRLRTRKAICAMAVRERFDAFCLQQTVAAGAELEKIEGILALREFATHAEADVALSEGGVRTMRAAVVIGADGSNGQMRRLAAGLDTQRNSLRISADAACLESRADALSPEPGWYKRGFALEAMVPFEALPPKMPAGDAPHDLVFDFAPVSGGYGWMFPKGDHINIGVGGFVPRGMGGAAAETIGASYESVTRALLAEYAQGKLGVELERVPQVHVSGQQLGLGGQAYVPRGRTLLAGDAAGMVDPLTGEGIYSAIVSGQAAAGAFLACANNETDFASVADRYRERLSELQATLAFSHEAAQAFYREPGRGFRVARNRLLRHLMLKTYADGLPHAKLLAGLRAMGRVVSSSGRQAGEKVASL